MHSKGNLGEKRGAPKRLLVPYAGPIRGGEDEAQGPRRPRRGDIVFVTCDAHPIDRPIKMALALSPDWTREGNAGPTETLTASPAPTTHHRAHPERESRLPPDALLIPSLHRSTEYASSSSRPQQHARGWVPQPPGHENTKKTAAAAPARGGGPLLVAGGLLPVAPGRYVGIGMGDLP